MPFLVGVGFIILLYYLLIDLLAIVIASILVGAIIGLTAALLGFIAALLEKRFAAHVPFLAARYEIAYAAPHLRISRRPLTFLGRFRISLASLLAFAGAAALIAFVTLAAPWSSTEIFPGVVTPYWLPAGCAAASATALLMRLARRIDRCAGLGQAREILLPAAAPLQVLTDRAADLQGRLGVQLPSLEDVSGRFAVFLESNKLAVLRNPAIANEELDALAATLRERCETLSHMVERFESVKRKLEQASYAACSTRSPSMFELLDVLRNATYEARALLLEDQWNDFEAEMAATSSLLDDLIATCQAAAASAGATASATSPAPTAYDVLGVPPDISNDKLHQVIRFLRQAYHPDKIGSDMRMKEIEEAYLAIRHERGLVK